MPVDKESLRTVVVPGSLFNAIGSRLQKDLGPSAAENVLYELGRDAGRSFLRMAEAHMGAPIRDEEGLRRVLRMFDADFHWAEIALKEADVPAKFMVVEWRHGVGVPRGGSPRPVCHLGRGLLSGAASMVFGEPCDAIETQCEAMGADHCEIVVGVPGRIAEVAEAMERPAARRGSRR